MRYGLAPVLSTKPFLFLWLSEIFSQIAFYMLNFILVFVVFSFTHSSTAVAGIVLAFTVPAILLGMLAGVYVDHWDKRKVLFTTTLLRAFLSLALALFYRSVFLVYVFTFLLSVITQFFIPAETPMIPLLVRRAHLLSANALFGMGIQGSILVAFALSGPFLLLFSERYVFVALGLLFLAAAVFVQLINVPRKKIGEQETSTSSSIAKDLARTYNTMVKTKAIYQSLFLLGFSQILILVIAVIGPGFADEILHLPASQFLMVFVTPAALGMVLGAVTIGNFLYMVAKTRLISIGLLTAALSLLLMPFGSGTFLPLLVVLATVLGFANALIFVPSNTIVQEYTSNQLRGKVYGALSALAGLASLFPVIAAGSLSDIFGVSKVVFGIGVSILLVWVGYLLTN